MILSQAVRSVRRAFFISDCSEKCCVTILLIKAVLESFLTTIFKLSELRLEIGVCQELPYISVWITTNFLCQTGLFRLLKVKFGH